MSTNTWEGEVLRQRRVGEKAEKLSKTGKQDNGAFLDDPKKWQGSLTGSDNTPNKKPERMHEVVYGGYKEQRPKRDQKRRHTK